jgi:hypothetical protein
MSTCKNPDKPYEALSYTWGPPFDGFDFPDEEISLCGTPVTIKANLADALRNFRQSFRSYRIWVDALCINQNDSDERSSQVSMMSKIYSSASRVLVWLGKDDAQLQGRIAIDFCKAIILRRPNYPFIWPPCQPDWATWLQDSWKSLIPLRMAFKRVYGRPLHKNLTIVDLKHYVWPALSELSKRRYFNRRWILQEVLRSQAAIIYCGATSILWKDLEAAFHTPSIRLGGSIRNDLQIQWELRPFHIAYGKYDHMREYRKETTEDFFGPSSAISLAQRLQFFQSSDCADPRDRVYSLLQLGDGQPCIPVDYSVNEISLWVTVARALVTEGYWDVAIEMAAH